MFTWRTKRAILKAVWSKNAPFYVQFYISNRCHLRCAMCNIVQATADLEPVAGEQFDSIAENLRRIGAGVVLLTGGEPFLRPDIPDLVRALKARGLDVRLQTAGLQRTWERIAACVALGASDINVSLDSLDEALSDAINGVDGSWHAAIETIAYVSRILPQNEGLTAFGCVLSPHNLAEIEPILELATRIGWWLSLVPVHISPRADGFDFRGRDRSFAFHSDDSPALPDLVTRLKAGKRDGQHLFDSDDYLDSMADFVRTGEPSWRRDGVCDSPGLYFAILPDGRFAPCCDHRLAADLYVYDDAFPEIFRSPRFRQQVLEEVTGACPGCNFGSFPEMTLSVRSWRTLYERIRLQMTAGRTRRKQLSEAELLEIIAEIREKWPVYREPRGDAVPHRPVA